MTKRKICVVITARPSYSRVKSVLLALQKNPLVELQLIVAASALLDRYGTASKFIEQDGFKITAKVFNILEGSSLSIQAKTTGLGILELSTLFENLKPDAVVTIADRYETMATAIAASYMNIPLVHIQGGEVSGNIDEKVRHAITKLADIHFVSSEDAKIRVVKMGESPSQVFNFGCPSIDLARDVQESRGTNFDPISKYGGVGNISLDLNNYIVVMQHPVTTEFKDAKEQINITLKAIQKLDVSCFWFWPNVDAGSDETSKGIRLFRENNPDNKIHFFKNMEPEDFLCLILRSKCLIGNSSVGIREASYLSIPVVNIGSRQKGRLRGPNVIDVQHDVEAIVSAFYEHNKSETYPSSHIYGNGNSGEQIANLLAIHPLSFLKQICF